MTDRQKEEHKLPPLSKLNEIFLNESNDTYEEESSSLVDITIESNSIQKSRMSRFNRYSSLEELPSIKTKRDDWSILLEEQEWPNYDRYEEMFLSPSKTNKKRVRRNKNISIIVNPVVNTQKDKPSKFINNMNSPMISYEGVGSKVSRIVETKEEK